MTESNEQPEAMELARFKRLWMSLFMAALPEPEIANAVKNPETPPEQWTCLCVDAIIADKKRIRELEAELQRLAPSGEKDSKTAAEGVSASAPEAVQPTLSPAEALGEPATSPPPTPPASGEDCRICQHDGSCARHPEPSGDDVEHAASMLEHALAPLDGRGRVSVDRDYLRSLLSHYRAAAKSPEPNGDAIPDAWVDSEIARYRALAESKREPRGEECDPIAEQADRGYYRQTVASLRAQLAAATATIARVEALAVTLVRFANEPSGDTSDKMRGFDNGILYSVRQLRAALTAHPSTGGTNG